MTQPRPGAQKRFVILTATAAIVFATLLVVLAGFSNQAPVAGRVPFPWRRPGGRLGACYVQTQLPGWAVCQAVDFGQCESLGRNRLSTWLPGQGCPPSEKPCNPFQGAYIATRGFSRARCSYNQDGPVLQRDCLALVDAFAEKACRSEAPSPSPVVCRPVTVSESAQVVPLPNSSCSVTCTQFFRCTAM